MRLRKIVNAQEDIDASEYSVLNPQNVRGCWKEVFGNDNKIRVEVGTGKGDFIIGMARLFPNINFIGVEKFSSVLIRAIEKLEDGELKNLKFIRFDAKDLNEIFSKEEIDTIYLNFSDPWPKTKHSKRRLTSKLFVEQYKNVLIDGGLIIQKTDNTQLFDYSNEVFLNAGLECLEKSYDLHKSNFDNFVMTEYEKKFTRANIPIKYAKYIFKRDVNV